MAFVFVSSLAFSQVFYSVKPDYLKLKHDGNNIIIPFQASYPDTNINNAHSYFPRNYLGNIGLASPNYILNYKNDELGFKLYPSPLLNDMFSEKQVEFYRSKGPYADLTGIGGSKQLQILKLLFTHTYKDKVNITLKFNRYTSQGFYAKQQTTANNFFLTSNYTKKNERVGYYFYYINNGNRNQENGGIIGDTLSAKSLIEPKELLGVRLISAVRENKEHKLMLNPWFKLNNSPDSLNKLNSYIQIKSKFALQSYIYKDPSIYNNTFYQLTYIDTSKTYDSTGIMKFTNEINYSLLNGNKNFGLSVGYRNEINRLWQKTDSSFINDIVFSDFILRRNFKSSDSARKTNNLQNLSNFQYVFSGPNIGNYTFENKIEVNLNGKIKTKLFLNVNVSSRNADHIYNNWVSNNFWWNNNGFKSQQMQQVHLGINIKSKFGVSVLFQNQNNFLYFDDLAYPRQYSGTIQNLGVNSFCSLLLFKHLGLTLDHTFQTTSHNAYLSIPQNISTVKLFYSAISFKDNLQLNIGAQGQIYSSFYGNAYMPATQIFYLQYSRATTNYPFVDAYINFRIRPVTIFIKMENALQGLLGSGYSLVPGYFQPDRAFRFGITWMFFD